MACQTRCESFWLTAGEALMVRETVAIETLANAATVRMSGLLGTVVRLPFRLTQSCYFVFVQVPKIRKLLWNTGSTAQLGRRYSHYRSRTRCNLSAVAGRVGVEAFALPLPRHRLGSGNGERGLGFRFGLL